MSGTYIPGNDSLHRLISGSFSSGINAGVSFQETYDHFGNRNQQTVSSSSGKQSTTYLNFTQGNNRVDGWSYDAAGNLLDDGVNQYLYDGEGRLCAVYEYSTSGAITGYYYEADGMRLAKGPLTAFTCDLTQNNLTPGNAYAYGPNGEELEEMTGYQLNFSHFNIFLEGELLGTFTGTTYSPANWEYALNDWVGTKRVIVNYDGSISTSFFSAPFGDYLNNLGPGADPSEQHFTGKERDTESGLDYFGARYYNSNMGRFLSPDPAGVRAVKLANPQTWNWYAYTMNNPLRYTDPTGMYTCADDHNKCGTNQDKAFEASRQKDLQSTDKGVAAAAKAYGDPTKDNHVGVQFTDAKNGNTSLSITTNGKTVSYGITVSIPNGATGTSLDGLVGHEGTHVEQDQSLAGSFTPNGSFNGTLNLNSYDAESPAYRNQATIWQQSGQTWTMNGNGQFLVNPGDTPSQVNQTINQFLKDPANGYGVSPQNPGPPLLNFTNEKQ